MTTAPLKTFFIYAHEDSTAVELLRKQLVSLEKSESIGLWYDGKILPGQKWDDNYPRRCRVASRSDANPRCRDNASGFRLAATPSGSARERVREHSPC